jgi:D-ribulokinase
MDSDRFYLGIDFGTSGGRALILDRQGQVHHTAHCQFAEGASQNWIATWQDALWGLLADIPQPLRQQLKAIAVNGTSATVLLCDRAGTPLGSALLYNDGRGEALLATLSQIAPPNHPVLSATSSLVKLLWWQQQPEFTQAVYFLHQADWLGFLLHEQLGISDYHNSLKLGYDVSNLCYPDWLLQMEIAPLLPKVLVPGTPIGSIKPSLCDRYGFSPDCQVCAGTTDSIAAFLASGADKPGEAVTSLGSTLVLKLLSHTPVEEAQYGIYSHRLGHLWLVGGASNTGGAILQQFFNPKQLQALSLQICSDQASPLNYYPLLKPGERFPISDPKLLPQLDPRPENPVEFLHGLLESIAKIEARGYELLHHCGATPLQRVYTAGGGAVNQTWQAIRARQLQVPVLKSAQTEAAYGTAYLALRGLSNSGIDTETSSRDWG